MSPKENQFIQDRIDIVSKIITDPNSLEFPDKKNFLNYFSPNNQKLLESIGSQLDLYLHILSNVNRWEYHHLQLAVDSIKGQDNDYLHTLNGLKILNKIKNLNLHSKIDFDSAELINTIHDGGEGITGDICQHHPFKKELEGIKKLETKIFSPLVLRQLKGNNLVFRNRLRSLYKRYVQRENNEFDSEAHLVKFIDHLEGNSFGMKNVYNRQLLSNLYPDNVFPIDPDKIVFKSIESEINQLQIVLSNLSFGQDKLELVSFYRENFFSNYHHYGYSNIASHFDQKLDHLTSPPINSARQSLPSF